MLRPYEIGVERCGFGEVEIKSRDLGDDRGYRVIVVLVSVGLRPNPHPLTTEGAAPKRRLADYVLRTWDAAVLRPYTNKNAGKGAGATKS